MTKTLGPGDLWRIPGGVVHRVRALDGPAVAARRVPSDSRGLSLTKGGSFMARVVVLGSSNTDMIVRLPRLPSSGETLLGGEFSSGPGGKGANQAVAARRAGAAVTFLSAVGDDPLGHEALARYRRESIDVSEVLLVPQVASGVALIFVNDAGENMIGVAPGANAHLDAAAIERLPDALFESGGVLLAGLEVPLATVATAVRPCPSRSAGACSSIRPLPTFDSSTRRFSKTSISSLPTGPKCTLWRACRIGTIPTSFAWPRKPC